MVEKINFDKLPRTQQKVLGVFAIGQSIFNKKAIDALLKKGLLVAHERWHRDRFGVFTFTEYEVPVWVHIQWCDWCSKQWTPD